MIAGWLSDLAFRTYITLLLFFRHIFRYEAVLLRARFDENKNVKDARQAQKLLIDGERELFEKQHFQPKKCIQLVNNGARI